MTNLQRFLVLALPLLSSFSCGGGGGPSGPGVPVGDLKARLRDALCGLEVRCGRYPDKNTCAGAVYAELQLFADLGSGKIQYDGQAAADCLNAYAQVGCNLSDQANTTGVPTQACQAALTGTVADGGACLINEECVSRSCNLTTCGGAMCCAGVCQTKLAVGEDCTARGSVCVDDAFCKRTTMPATGICTTKLAAGQACGASDTCAPGLACNTDPATGSGTCGGAPAEGEACPAGVCDASGDLCDPTTKTCVARIAVGGDCVSIGCVSWARCDATAMKCVARAPAGGACGTSVDCIDSLPCTNGVCVSRPDVPACP
jgi:hypothetical protein